jgi:hypothetical protein
VYEVVEITLQVQVIEVVEVLEGNKSQNYREKIFRVKM